METSQEVNTTVEKEEETQDVENEQNEDETVLDSSPINNMSESSSLQFEGGGKWSTTIYLSKKPHLSHLSSLSVRKRKFSEQTRDSVFTFDSRSLDQPSSMEPRQPEKSRTRSLSRHSIRSPRERKKIPSSPIHRRLHPSKIYSNDINSSGKSTKQERLPLFASLQPNSLNSNINKALSSEITPSSVSRSNSFPEQNVTTNSLSSSLSEVSSSTIPPSLDLSLRSSKSEISQNTQPSSSLSSIKVRPRRNRPSVTVSWIVPKASTLRKTWSSRSNTDLSITFASPTSPVSSPVRDSEQSVDIVVKPSDYYFRRKRRYSLNTSSLNPLGFISGKDASPTDSTSSDQPSTNQSISPFDPESYRSSWISESPLLPFSSTSRLLSVSHNLSEEELQPPKDAVYEKILLTSQKRFSILPSQDKEDNQIIIDVCDNLIDTSDLPSAGAMPKDSCDNELEGMDFSNYDKFSAQTPTIQSPENDEEMIKEYEFLMEEEIAKKQIMTLDGEELQGGDINSDENIIPDEYFGKSTPSKLTAEPPSVSLPTSPVIANNHKNETPVTESTFYRDTSPMPPSISTSPLDSPISSPLPDKISPISSPIVDGASPISSPIPDYASPVSSPLPDDVSPPSPSHHSKKSTSHFLNSDDDILNLKTDTIISYFKELSIKSSSISPLPLPPPPTPNSIVPSPSTPVSPISPSTPLTPAASISIPESLLTPTSQQLDCVQKFNMEFERKQEEKEKEEKKRRERILLEAEQSIQQWKEKHQKQIHEELMKRKEQQLFNYRLFEFSCLFGDCSGLLLPYIRILDTIFGPVLQPSDDLHHLDQCYRRYIEAGVLDQSSFAHRMKNKYPSMQVREGMIKEIDTSRYLQSMFTSFSFYYQCALNYSYMRIRNFI